MTPPSRSFRINLLFFSAGAILAATAIPVEIHLPGFSLLDLRVTPSDVLVNLLLYIPLGMSMSKSRKSQVFLVACGLSAAIEMCQLCLAGRYASPVDVLANSMGAMSGRSIGKMGETALRRTLHYVLLRRSNAMFLLGAVVLFLAWAGVSNRPAPRTDFSNWDETFHLAAGDELTGGREWQGRLIEFAILATPLDTRLMRELARLGPGSIKENAARFPHEPIVQSKGAIDLDRIEGTPLLDQHAREALFEALKERGTFTLLVWCNTSDLTQTGPARILTYSADAFQRNFTLGQEGRSIVFRLRTPVTGPNGLEPEIQTPPVLPKDQDVLLASIYDGRVARVYIDGWLVGRQNLTAAACSIPPLWDTELPALTALVAALTSLAGLGLAQPRTRSGWRIAAVACGTAGGLASLVAGFPCILPGYVWMFSPLGPAAGILVGHSIVSTERTATPPTV